MTTADLTGPSGEMHLKIFLTWILQNSSLLEKVTDNLDTERWQTTNADASHRSEGPDAFDENEENHMLLNTDDMLGVPEICTICISFHLSAVCILTEASACILTGREDGSYLATPLGPGDGLQSDAVLCGASQLSHAVRGGCRAEHHLLKPHARTHTLLRFTFGLVSVFVFNIQQNQRCKKTFIHLQVLEFIS